MGRRAHGDGTLFQRNDGRWVGRLPQHLLPPDWNRSVPSVTAPTKKECAAKLRRLELDWSPTSPDDVTVAEWIDRFLDQHPVRASSKDNYRRVARLHIVPVIGHVPMSQLRRGHVKTVKQRMVDAGMKANTVKVPLSVLSMACDEAVADELLTHNPCDTVDPPPADEPVAQALNPAQASRLLEAADEHPYGPTVWLGLTMGLRVSEVTDMTWPELDLDAGTWTPRSLAAVKTEESAKPVPVPPETLERLRRQVTVLKKGRLEAPVRWSSTHDDRVFRRLPLPHMHLKKHGAPLVRQNVAKWLDDMLAAAGLPHIRFHDLRHSCVSVLYARGVEPLMIQRIVRHASLDVTNRVYLHVPEEDVRSAVSRVRWG